MNPAIDEMLRDSRRQIREWKRSLSLFEAGVMKLHANGVDISHQHAGDLKRYIGEHEALIKKYDPENVTADENVEFGHVGNLASELYPNRPIAFTVDENGEADALHVFNSEQEARAFVGGRPGYRVGHVSQDGWSIVGIEP